MKSYSVTYERDEEGWWVASVREVRGCHTQGRTLAETGRRVREALSLFVDDAKTAELVDHVKLPAPVRRQLTKVRAARRRADRENARARESTAAAIRALRKQLHLSLRDASELLGLSHQRIQQLASSRA